MRAHTHSHLHLMLAEEKYSREVVIPVDFSDGLEIYPNIAEQLKDLDIGVLSKLVGEKKVSRVKGINSLSLCYLSVIITCILSFTVNNVGLGYEHPEFLNECSFDVSGTALVFH